MAELRRSEVGRKLLEVYQLTLQEGTTVPSAKRLMDFHETLKVSGPSGSLPVIFPKEVVHVREDGDDPDAIKVAGEEGKGEPEKPKQDDDGVTRRGTRSRTKMSDQEYAEMLQRQALLAEAEKARKKALAEKRAAEKARRDAVKAQQEAAAAANAAADAEYALNASLNQGVVGGAGGDPPPPPGEESEDDDLFHDVIGLKSRLELV